MLVHKSQGVHQLVHRHNQPSFKASRVQVHCLVAPSHAKFTCALGAWVDGIWDVWYICAWVDGIWGIWYLCAWVDGIWGVWYICAWVYGIWGKWYLCAWVDGHVVGALHFCRDEGDAGEEVGDVVHRLPCLVSQI